MLISLSSSAKLHNNLFEENVKLSFLSVLTTSFYLPLHKRKILHILVTVI